MTKSSFESVSNVKEYDVYQDIWVPKLSEALSTEKNPVILKTNTLPV